MSSEYDIASQINENLREVELLAAKLGALRQDNRFNGLGELAKMLRLGFYDLYSGQNPRIPLSTKDSTAH